jgi:predicted RNase H-like HicB family nuclease
MGGARGYRVILEPDEGTLRCVIPAFPSIFTFGTSRQHALAMAKEAIELEIDVLRERGRTIPEADVDICPGCASRMGLE